MPISTDEWRFYRAPGGVEVRTARITVSPFYDLGFPQWVAYRLEIRTRGNKWQRTKTTTRGRFGDSSDNATMPGLADSRQLFGVREKALEVNVVQLDAAAAQDIARSVVENNLRPVAFYTVPLAPPWRVRPEHLGRDIGIPGEGTGTLEAWSYDESHTPGSSRTESGIRVRLTRPITRTDDSSGYGLAGYGSGSYGG
ncbi:MAG: hypothetical protein HC933_02155 [Pleurocapsa sp. SU_196_0]|nr:hypothetical protein [Pleurocapsa sp. SU_196_0]